MNHATRRLILRTCWMTLIAAAPAQTDYYVNGMTGLDQPTHGGAAATPRGQVRRDQMETGPRVGTNDQSPGRRQ